MKKLRPGEMVQIKTVEELLGVVNEESAMDIEIYKICSFQGHPFKVVDDDKMLELVESIKAKCSHHYHCRPRCFLVCSLTV